MSFPRRFSSFLFLAAGAWVSAPLIDAAESPKPAKPRAAAALYAQLCASCHGAKLEGGSGSNLVDDVWQHGADDASVTAAIARGYPENGMPGFETALSPAEIRGLVIFLREERAKAEQRGGAGRSTLRPAADATLRTEEHAYRIETVVAEGLGTPWSMAWLPDGRLLVTEREGPLRIVENGRLQAGPVRGTPAVWSQGQGGLLEVAVHPDYARNGWIYLGYSDPGPNGTAMTAIVRGRLRDGAWVDQESLFKAPTGLYKRGKVHFGTRFVFQDGYLFFSIGERGAKEDSQDLTRPNGKVHRIHDDGRVPEDNPFVTTPGAFPTIWSYGNRNPQGLARHPTTGDLWETEHGPRGGDELNRILPGRNYGWPVITYGMNYDGTPMTDRTAGEGLEQPVLHWTPSIAVCGIAFSTGDRFPRWKNHLFVTGLASEELRRLVIDDRGRVTHQELVLKGLGRLRHVAAGPDGFLYLAVEQPGRIVRLVPSE